MAPEYGVHTHAKVGGGKHSHEHPYADPGHRHNAGSSNNPHNVGLLPTPAADKAWFIDFDIKSVVAGDGGTLVLEGYANTWDLDRDGEVTAKSAFDTTLDEYLANPQVLWAHKENHQIGTVVEARTDSKGLWIRAEIPPPPTGTEAWHVKVYNDIKRGILKAFSMGGVFVRSKSVTGLIERVKLFEVSVVSIPANPTSLFALAESKGLYFEDAKAAMEPGVGRGHGRHHHGALGPRGGRIRQHASRIRRRRGKAIDAEDDDMQTSSVVGQLDLDDLIEAVVDALEEVADSDYDDDDKLGSVEDLLQEFYALAAQIVPDDAEDDVPGTDTEKLFRLLASKSDQQASQRINSVLARLQHKEKVMADTHDDSKGAKVSVDRAQFEAMSGALADLQDERREKQMEAQAEAKALKMLDEERATEEAKAAKLAEEQGRMDDLVARALENYRAGYSSGKKFQLSSGTDSGPTGRRDGYKSLPSFLKDIRDSKRGNPAAWERLTSQQQKSAEFYATDADGEINTKALAEGTSTAGGFMVPPQYAQGSLAEFRLAAAKVSPLLTTLQVNSNLVYIPRETNVPTVGWTAENAGKTSTDQTFGQLAVNIFTLAGIAKVSNQLLEDSSPAVDTIVRKDLGRVLAQAEDIAFINGTGTGQPTGILNTTGVLTVAYSAPAAGSGLLDAISNAIGAVDQNFFDLPTAIMVHPRMVAKLRNVKDTTGRPILEPAYAAMLGATAGNSSAAALLQAGAGNLPGAYGSPLGNGGVIGTIWGMPVISNANIPTNTGGGTNESPIIVGVWSEAYRLERTGITLDVSNEAGTSFEQNQTWFRGETRVGFTAARQPTAFCYVTGLTNAIAG